MAGWIPKNDFEEEILAIEPENNMIFADFDQKRETSFLRPMNHLNYVEEKKALEEARKKEKQNKGYYTDKETRKFNLICKMHELSGIKPAGQLPTINDWDTEDNLEKETIAAMRKLGFDSCKDQALDPIRTHATNPVTEGVMFVQNGKKRMPIFLDSKYFELKPKVELPLDDHKEVIGKEPSNSSSENLNNINYEKLSESPSNSSGSFSESKKTNNVQNKQTEKHKKKCSSKEEKKLNKQFYTPKEIYELKRKNVLKKENFPAPM